MLRLLTTPKLDKDGWTLRRFPFMDTDEVRSAANLAYDEFEPGRNVTNKLARGIAWAMYAQDGFTCLERDEYSLPANLNPEEQGNIRCFNRIPEDFLLLEPMTRLYREIWRAWSFPEPSTHRAYEMQFSGIRYEPTLAKPAMPSPIIPHQDLVDGAIVCLNRHGDFVGGKSRLYTLDDDPLAEVDLQVGEALLIRDAQIKHQVTPVLMEPGDDWRPGDRAYRDVLLIRFQPVGR